MSVTGTFDVVGARGPLALFGSLDAERLAHGYLFTGPAGIGKKTFARRLAQSLLCSTPKPTLLGYCERCTDCTLVAAGTHPDLVESAGAIKIGDSDGDDDWTARSLVRELTMHGYRSRYHIVLAGDVSFATHEAANALLKTLEEPPAGVLVILTTGAPASLLATIRSRMIEVAFPPLAAAEVEAVLLAGAVPALAAAAAARDSLGSIVRAREILEGDGTTVRDGAFAWFVDVMNGDVGDAGFLGLDDRSLTGAQKRENVRAFIDVVRVAARDWAVAGLKTGGAVLPLAADQEMRLARVPSRGADAVAQLLGALTAVERLANSNVSPSLVVDYLRAQLSPRSSG